MNDEEYFIKNNLIEVDPETQVIIGLDHYDYGLPGSGILIWHVKEPDPAIYYDGIIVTGNLSIPRNLKIIG